jgi:hypothetical protein
LTVLAVDGGFDISPVVSVFGALQADRRLKVTVRRSVRAAMAPEMPSKVKSTKQPALIRFEYGKLAFEETCLCQHLEGIKHPVGSLKEATDATITWDQVAGYCDNALGRLHPAVVKTADGSKQCYVRVRIWCFRVWFQHSAQQQQIVVLLLRR